MGVHWITHHLALKKCFMTRMYDAFNRILSKKRYSTPMSEMYFLVFQALPHLMIDWCFVKTLEQVLNGHCDCSEGSGVLPLDLLSFFHQCVKTARVVERMRLNCCMYYDWHWTVIVVEGVKCQMGVSARPAYQHIVMLARLGAPRWTLARLCCQMLSVTCAPGVWNVASESPPKERWQNCGSLAKKVNKQKMKEKKQQQKFTGNRAALRTKSPFRPTISAPIMSEGQKNLLLIAVLMPNWQIQATIFCEFSFYRIKQWDKEKGGIKWGGGIPKGGLQQGAEHEVIVPARTNYGSKKV